LEIFILFKWTRTGGMVWGIPPYMLGVTAT